MSTPPTPKPDPDFTHTVALIKSNVEKVAVDGMAYKDFRHYVFEVAMEAVYGPDIWKWWNATNKE